MFFVLEASLWCQKWQENIEIFVDKVLYDMKFYKDELTR